jgi:hypothetical protein
VHQIVVFSAPVDGGIMRDVLQREWHNQAAGTHACLGDECSALGSSLRRGGTLEWRELWYQPRIGGDRLTQVGAYPRVLTGIVGKCHRHVGVDRLLKPPYTNTHIQ